MMTKTFQENPTYFRGRCKWWKCMWYWASNCLKVQNTIKWHYINVFLQSFVMMTSSIYWIQGIWERIQLQNIEGHEILRSKPESTMCFWASLLMIIFEDLNFIFYIWVFNTTINVIVKKIQFKQHFATTFEPLTQKNIRALFWSSLPCLHPLIHCYHSGLSLYYNLANNLMLYNYCINSKASLLNK